jgi:hypothetical protein
MNMMNSSSWHKLSKPTTHYFACFLLPSLYRNNTDGNKLKVATVYPPKSSAWKFQSSQAQTKGGKMRKRENARQWKQRNKTKNGLFSQEQTLFQPLYASEKSESSGKQQIHGNYYASSNPSSGSLILFCKPA